MTPCIPMHEILYSIDGKKVRNLRRSRALVDAKAMRSFVSQYDKLIFWYDSSLFDIDPIDQDVYCEAYRQLLGKSSTYFVGKRPSGTALVPQTLLTSYAITKLTEMNEFDTILFCAAGKHYQIPPERRLVTLDELGKGTCMIGAYATRESRTPFIEACAQKSLSCLVVRALRMDADTQDYTWESEYRTSCIYI